MAKDYWGKGTGPLTPSDGDGELPATNPAPARATPQPTARERRTPGPIPQMPRTVARSRTPVALDETETRPRAKIERPGVSEDEGTKRLSLPDVVRTVSFGRKVWFGVSFAAPVLLGALYLFLIAPDQYVTEYRFSVRVPAGQESVANANGVSVASLFGGNPAPVADQLDNYTVADYVRSPQAARDVDAKTDLRTMFNKPFDPFSKLGEKASAERLGRYWNGMVYSSYDIATGLGVVRVSAYSAADSYAIANNLLTLSSDVVNSIGSHSQQDSLRFAQAQYDRATAKVASLNAELLNLRRQSNLVDPEKGAVDGNVDFVNNLIRNRAQLQVQLELMAKQLGNANAPQVNVLRQQVATLDQQISQARAAGGSTKGGANIAVTVGRFEELSAKLKDAQTVQTEALQAVSSAQTSAEAQRVYLSTYVRPTMPEAPVRPQRWLDMLLITLIAAMAWVLGRLLGNSIMEHA